MRHIGLVFSLSVLALGPGCLDSGDSDPDPEPPTCSFDSYTPVTISGSVVDFSTKAPVPGAKVDITSAWNGYTVFPGPDACPVLATVETGADGKFGPLTVPVPSDGSQSFVLFLVDGAGRAPTASDNRICAEATCTLEHTIAAPSLAVADSWRQELAAGGMTGADTKGLIAFEYRNTDGTPADSVAAEFGTDERRPLAPGTEVRYLRPDRAALAPASTSATTTAGVALIGRDQTAFIGGHRGQVGWNLTGCLLEPGWIFLEDLRAP